MKGRKKVVHNLFVRLAAEMKAITQYYNCTKVHRQEYAIWNKPPASCFLARHTWTDSAFASHAHTLRARNNTFSKKSTYDRCRMNHHRTSWCSRRWSPPTAGDTPPDGSMTPPYRWYWVLWMPPPRKYICVSIFILIDRWMDGNT